MRYENSKTQQEDVTKEEIDAQDHTQNALWSRQNTTSKKQVKRSEITQKNTQRNEKVERKVLKIFFLFAILDNIYQVSIVGCSSSYQTPCEVILS